jgi:hypothetical protein
MGSLSYQVERIKLHYGESPLGMGHLTTVLIVDTY